MNDLMFWAIIVGFSFAALGMCYVAIYAPEMPWERWLHNYLDGRE